MNRSLPQFTYLSDDFTRNVFIQQSATCHCCGKDTEHHYNGTIYRVGDSDITLCPWCIHDGSAAAKYACSFNDLYDEALHDAIAAEVCERTPGYSSWQDQSWVTHCNDACVYHGDASAKDVADASAETRQKWMSDYEMDEDSWSQMMAGYQPGGDQGVYKFVCRHCGLVSFNWDYS